MYGMGSSRVQLRVHIWNSYSCVTGTTVGLDSYSRAGVSQQDPELVKFLSLGVLNVFPVHLYPVSKELSWQ